MSESAESAQPSEGQDAGNDEGGFGTYQDYLNSQVPEDYRPHVEPFLRDIQSNAEAKFREHSDYRKEWEPYGNIELGDGNSLNLKDYDPESLAGLIQFAELMGDESEFKNWWTTVGQEQGFLDEYTGEDDSEEFDDDEGLEGLNLDTFRTALEETLNERLAPFEERQQQEQYQREVDSANKAIDEQMQTLEDEHGEFDRDAVYRLAYAFADQSDDPIQAGFEEYMRVTGQAETNAVRGKLDAPAPPESGVGPANTSAQAPTQFSEASKMAKERLAQIRQT